MVRLQKRKLLVVCMIILCSVTCCFEGCSVRPPSGVHIEKTYLAHEPDFHTVAEYLERIAADSVYVKNDTGTAMVDLANQKIDNPVIVSAIQRLWKTGCSSIYMNQSDHSICFVLWKTGSIGDAEAGLLYALDPSGGNRPTTQYLTELQPLQVDSWYYYVADYEQWRNLNTSIIKQK